MLISPRLFITLLALPLSAFTCFPKPNIQLLIEPPKTAQLFAYQESEEAKAILSRLRSFAVQYNLSESNCKGVWPSWGDAEAPCFAFTRFRDEGIGLYFLARPSRQRWEVFLVKERRVFGIHSTSEVENNFDAAIKKPLLEALGESRVEAR